MHIGILFSYREQRKPLNTVARSTQFDFSREESDFREDGDCNIYDRAASKIRRSSAFPDNNAAICYRHKVVVKCSMEIASSVILTAKGRL